MTHKLDLFQTLDKLNRKQYDFYSTMSEEEQKSFAPLVLSRWMSGTSDAAQVIIINEFVNPYIFSVQRHKDLLWKLLCVAGPGKFSKYNWIKQQSAKNSHPETTTILSSYFNVGTNEAKHIMGRFTCDDILDMALEIGADQPTLKKIEKEFKEK